MGLLGSMTVAFKGDTSGLQGAISGAKNAISSLASNPMVAVGIGLGAIAVASVGFGVASVKAAADFQEGMSKVQAYCGLTKQQTDSLGTSILQLATQMGQSPKAMADALYPIMSSGYSTAQALQILKLSAMTAAASGANMATVADALTTSLKAMHAPASDAGIYMDDINKIVSLGKGQVSDYAAVIGKLSLSAGSAKVPFADMGAALATLTTHGFPSVAQAANSLGNLFTQIGPKVDALATHAKKLGISFDESKFKSMDLSDKLAYLQQVTGGNQGELLKLVGGSTLALKAFNALQGSAQDYTSNLKSMQGAQGTTTQVFQTTYGDWNNSINRLNATFQVLMIQVGQKLLPILTPMLNAVTGLIGQFTAWASASSGMSPILSNISGMLGIMAGNWRDFGSQIQGILSGPLQQFGSTIGQLLPGFISQFLRALNLASIMLQDIATGVATVAAPALKILGQVFKGAQGTIETVLNAVEGQLIPALENLYNAVFPVIAAIVSWVANSGLVPAVFSGISGAVSFLVPILSGLISGIASVVSFFSQNQAAAASLLIPLGILGGYFVFLGVSAVVSFIAAAPAMIAGFIAGAAAAWTMAAGVIAATWPFLLIGAAVGLVIAIIVLLVQHWGAVVAFLKGVWSSFASWFSGALQAVGTFFVNVWNGIVAGLRAAWNFIVTVVKIGIMTVLVILFAPIIAIAALFIWLYAHNTYFKMLVDKIVSIIQGVASWLVGIWHNIVNWIVGQWNNLKLWAEIIFIAIYVTIQAKIQQVQSFLTGIWTNIVGYLTGVWTSISTKVTELWTSISNCFASAWSTYVATPLHNLWNQIVSFFSGWPAQAMQWGINLIQGFINGIMGMIGNVGNAIGNVASKVAGFLGFHSPSKEGPGQELDLWGPNMIKGFASGIQKGIPMVQAAVNMVMQPIKMQLGSSLTNAAHASTMQQASANTANSGKQEIYIQLDSNTLAHVTGDRQARIVRLKQGRRAA